jgi:hypothetical protein
MRGAWGIRANFSAAHADEAHCLMESGQHIGKILLTEYGE